MSNFKDYAYEYLEDTEFNDALLTEMNSIVINRTLDKMEYQFNAIANGYDIKTLREFNFKKPFVGMIHDTYVSVGNNDKEVEDYAMAVITEYGLESDFNEWCISMGY